MRPLFSLFSYLLFWLGLPFLLTHPKLRRGIWSRLGYIHPPIAPTNGAPRIWMHGASAGDVQALWPTARALRQRYPHAVIILSTITNSGRAMAERLASAFDAVIYLPYDLPGATRRTLRAVKPDLLILEYTELWPQLILAAHDRGVPVVLHNGRIAASKLTHYRWLFRLTGNLLQKLSLLLMRNPSEAEHAVLLRAPKERVHVTGDTKFDNLSTFASSPTVTDAICRATDIDSKDALIWVAGSTHEGEEEILLQAFVQLKQRFPTLRLLIAPRYINRATRIQNLAERHKLSVTLRSQGNKSEGHTHTGTSTASKSDVIILDSIGELAACYSLATIVFVGGSLIPHGGHNIMEPAACGKPVLFGPHMDNFAEPVQILLGHGGLQVTDGSQFVSLITDLLNRPAYCRELGALAQQCISTVRGATQRNVDLIATLLA